MNKIDKLTDAQIAKFPEYVKRWTDIGLSTEPADRPRAEAAFTAMYAQAGLPRPHMVWCGSPLSQSLTRAVLIANPSVGASVWASVRASVGASVGASVRASVGDSVWASVGASVWDRVWDSVWASVGASVEASVRASVRASVGASVGDSVWDSVWASVGASVRDSVRDSVRASVWASVYGAHDANRLAFYRFFRDECGLTAQTDALGVLWELGESCGWCLPHHHICWLSERHNILRRDEDGALHCDDGPALAYPDGWALWYLHGVSVDEQIVLRPESQTVEQIHGEDNEERRRCRIERFGWSRYLKESGAKVVDQRRNDRDCQQERLYSLRDGSRRIRLVDPSTGREYFQGVPQEVETCEQAQLWMSHGLDSRVIHGS